MAFEDLLAPKSEGLGAELGVDLGLQPTRSGLDLSTLLTSAADQEDSVTPRKPPTTDFLSTVGERLMTGFLGTPLPRIGASMGIGAALGAAGGGGIGALPGALIGAAVGGLADIMSNAGAEAVKRTLQPTGGLETPFGTISPELADTITDLGLGVIGGGLLIKAAGRLGPKMLPRLVTAKREADLLANQALKIPKDMQLELFPRIVPADPNAYRNLPDGVKAVFRSLEQAGVPLHFDAFDESPATLSSLNKLFDEMLTKDDLEKISKLGNILPIPEAQKALRKGTDWVRLYLLRQVAAPRSIMMGNRAGEMLIDTTASAELTERAIFNHYWKRYQDIMTGIPAEGKDRLTDVWHNFQGMAPKKLVTKGVEDVAKLGKIGAPGEQLEVFLEDIPRAAPPKLDTAIDQMRKYLTDIKRPDLIPKWEAISGMHKEIGEHLVAMGKLQPDELIPNYLSRVRDKIYAEKAMLIEKEEGYFPISIERTMSKEAKAYFMSERVLQAPPKELGIDQIMQTYLRSFSHLVMRDAIRPRVAELLGQITDPVRSDYAMAYLNRFFGYPQATSEYLGRQTAEVLKQVQFWRTIGGSLLTPLINTTQRLNVLGYVGVKNWTKAMIPNTHMAQLAKEAGVLAEGGINYADLLAMDSTYTGLRKGMKMTSDVLGSLFFASEQGNILHAFQAGMYRAMERGIPEKMAVEYARMLADRTQFISRIARTPALAMKSDIGGVVMQFKTFMVNQAAFMENLVRTNPMGAARYMTSQLLLAGPDAILPGADLAVTRKIYGKPFKVPGAIGAAGMALAQHVSVFGIQPDDVKRLYSGLPGPTADHIMNLASAITGMNISLDLEEFGKPLTPDQRATMATRSIPFAGTQLNRIRQYLKVSQTGLDDRAAQTMWETLPEAFWGEPAKGRLHDQLNRSEAVMRLIGVAPQRLYEQRAYQELASQASDDYKELFSQITELQMRGRIRQANELVRQFRQKYPELIGFAPGPASYKSAAQRLMQPGARREFKALPPALRRAYGPQFRSVQSKREEG